LGLDIDPACAYPYDVNNEATFCLRPVEKVAGSDLLDALRGARYRLLAGCAPCQPFSTYSQGKNRSTDDRWQLLRQFARLIHETNPELVTMENVPRLTEHGIFDEFVAGIRQLGFHVCFRIVRCTDYGVPQQRQRLVLLASRLGPIALVPPTHPPGKHRTVRDAIGNLPPIKAGEGHQQDSLHRACSLAPINLKRIKASVPGGSWRDWNENLITKCHKRSSGRKYSSIYGRMYWDRPAPTLTTQFYNFGSGRYGHPQQDRALSFREGALLQTFPRSYRFVEPGGRARGSELGRLIGNAVPVRLGEVIGRSILKHIAAYG